MDDLSRKRRYQRIQIQLQELFQKTEDPLARMSTLCALLHHKFPHFFWTGFYLLQCDELLVGPYQGSLACLQLAPHQGVCWAAIDRKSTVIVPNVSKFPGHIACDSRSRSEIAVPLRNSVSRIVGVLDIDSREINIFNKIDEEELSILTGLIFSVKNKEEK